MHERRLYPRFPWARSVQLRSARGQRFAARSLDLSVAGIGLEMGREGVLGLAQSGSILCPGDRLEVVLPSAVLAAQGDLDLQCRVKEVRRISLEKYIVGIWFEELDHASQAALEKLVDDARQRRWG
jgi:hypothetical protein